MNVRDAFYEVLRAHGDHDADVSALGQLKSRTVDGDPIVAEQTLGDNARPAGGTQSLPVPVPHPAPQLPGSPSRGHPDCRQPLRRA